MRLCNKSSQPIESQECEGPPCDRRWTVSDWGPVSLTTHIHRFSIMYIHTERILDQAFLTLLIRYLAYENCSSSFEFQLNTSVYVPVLRCVWRGKDGARSDVPIVRWGCDVRGAVWPITAPTGHPSLWRQRLRPPLGRTGMATGKHLKGQSMGVWCTLRGL